MPGPRNTEKCGNEPIFVLSTTRSPLNGLQETRHRHDSCREQSAQGFYASEVSHKNKKILVTGLSPLPTNGRQEDVIPQLSRGAGPVSNSRDSRWPAESEVQTKVTSSRNRRHEISAQSHAEHPYAARKEVKHQEIPGEEQSQDRSNIQSKRGVASNGETIRMGYPNTRVSMRRPVAFGRHWRPPHVAVAIRRTTGVNVKAGICSKGSTTPVLVIDRVGVMFRLPLIRQASAHVRDPMCFKMGEKRGSRLETVSGEGAPCQMVRDKGREGKEDKFQMIQWIRSAEVDKCAGARPLDQSALQIQRFLWARDVAAQVKNTAGWTSLEWESIRPDQTNSGLRKRGLENIADEDWLLKGTKDPPRSPPRCILTHVHDATCSIDTRNPLWHEITVVLESRSIRDVRTTSQTRLVREHAQEGTMSGLENQLYKRRRTPSAWVHPAFSKAGPLHALEDANMGFGQPWL
ncbi:hypothetical protein EI94DRAFT_1782909 [Lactarius quietus]|nr:hypothetical protein EI94DRAFT_1782909 [Lactarius quietus]